MRILALVLCLAASAPAVEHSDVDRESAKSHTEQGTALYQRGDYEHALAEFSDARRLFVAPELDYDIARCLDRLGRATEAAAAYERYVAARPFDPKSAAISARAAQLRAIAGEQHGNERFSVELPVVRPKPVAPIAVAAVAGVAVVTGAVLLGVVGGNVSGAADHSVSHSRVDTLKVEAAAGYAMMGVAGVAAVVDVALWVRWSKHRHVEVRP